MRNVNLVDARAHLSKLVGRAAAGDSVLITRRGKASGPDHGRPNPAQTDRSLGRPRDDRQGAGAAGNRPRGEMLVAGEERKKACPREL